MNTQTVSSSFRSVPCQGSWSRNQEDIDLVHFTQQGRLEAFNELVLLYQDQIYNHAYWMLRDAAAAEDAAQETFYRAYRKIDSFDGSSFRAWIMRITTNYCLDRIRRRKCHQMLPLDSYDPDGESSHENSIWHKDSKPSPEQIVEQMDRRALINNCLMTLSPQHRSSIILVDIQEMNYQEAADILGTSLSSFKSRLFRARVKLMEAINQVQEVDLLLS